MNPQRYIALAVQADMHAEEARDPALQMVFREMAGQWRDLAAFAVRTDAATDASCG